MTPLQLKPSNASITSLDTDVRSVTRRELDSDRRKTKTRLIELLFAAGCVVAAKKVVGCNSEYLTLACSNGHRGQIVPTSRCRHRLCPYCAMERQRRAFLRLSPLLERYAKGEYRAVLITLTLNNSSDPLPIQDKQFKAAFRRLRRTKGWKDRISGALCGYEFTLTPTGWHYHAHLIAFRKTWYDQAELATHWQEAAKTDCAIVDIRAISDLAQGLRAALQYCFKPTDFGGWTANEILQFQKMSRIKRSDCFGELRGLKIDDPVIGISNTDQLFVGCPCPQCGEPLMKVKVSWRNLHKYIPITKDGLVDARAGPHGLELLPHLSGATKGL